MKRIVISIAACAYVLIAFAPKFEDRDNKAWKDKYCASLKNGEIIVMNGKSELFVDVTLENGTKITMDGYVIKPDGTKTALKSGECVDKDGNIVQGKKDKDKTNETK